jgi:hypothetical protein
MAGRVFGAGLRGSLGLRARVRGLRALGYAVSVTGDWRLGTTGVVSGDLVGLGCDPAGRGGEGDSESS